MLEMKLIFHDFIPLLEIAVAISNKFLKILETTIFRVCMYRYVSHISVKIRFYDKVNRGIIISKISCCLLVLLSLAVEVCTEQILQLN